MKIKVYENARDAGNAGGAAAAELIRQAIRERGTANIILATGTSQFETLNKLISEKDIEWKRVTMFHLDEYIGLSQVHPASFRKYLQERFLSKVQALKAAYLINGETNPGSECERLGHIISNHPIDVALLGIGENGHLAFNDPPADFETEQAYIIVQLDEECKNQHYGDGWFTSVDEVPKTAISMSVKQILKSKDIICTVTGSRKATAVKNSIEKPVSNLYPAGILQLHPGCIFYLDTESSALLSPGSFQRFL